MSAAGQSADETLDTAGAQQTLTDGQNVPDCHPLRMSKCTDPLKVVTDNRDLGFATSMNELQDMCPKLMEGLRCIDDFTIKCLDREHRAYFNTLYAGTTNVIVDLCQEGAYQAAYLRHAPCMRAVQTGYERCAAEYQDRIKSLNPPSYDDHSGLHEYGPEYEYEYIEDNYDDVDGEAEKRKRRKRSDPENGDYKNVAEEYSYDHQGASGSGGEESVQLLCCSFQKYLHCSETVVNDTCGYETAKFTKSFLDRMSGPLIQGHCQSYEYGSEGCTVTSSQPRADWGPDPGTGTGAGQEPHISSAPSHRTQLTSRIISLLLPTALLLACLH